MDWIEEQYLKEIGVLQDVPEEKISPTIEDYEREGEKFLP